jgi:hypothetical protein
LADLEKRATIKSSVRILDSDDDEEADREFFQKERELKERMERRALEGDVEGEEGSKVGKKAKKPRPRVSKKPVEEVFSDVEVVHEETEREDTPVLGSEVRDVESENGDIEIMNPKKKRRIRRALSTSSDDE